MDFPLFGASSSRTVVFWLQFMKRLAAEEDDVIFQSDMMGRPFEQIFQSFDTCFKKNDMKLEHEALDDKNLLNLWGLEPYISLFDG